MKKFAVVAVNSALRRFPLGADGTDHYSNRNHNVEKHVRRNPGGRIVPFDTYGA